MTVCPRVERERGDRLISYPDRLTHPQSPEDAIYKFMGLCGKTDLKAPMLGAGWIPGFRLENQPVLLTVQLSS